METPVYNDLYERLIRGEEKLALVGLGYVGMPIAVEFASDRIQSQRTSYTAV